MLFFTRSQTALRRFKMRISNRWQDFEVIDAGNGMKTERYKAIVVRRPDPVATWKPVAPSMGVDAFFDTEWHFNKTLPESWTLTYGDMLLKVRPTSFKHTGVFPEQAVNWDWMRNVIQSSSQEVRILNLFGYTGAATIACAMEPNVTEVVHIDALKSLNEWTRENISLNQLDHKMIRTITEDVMKFLNREKRRGRTYHGIIMDPPSFGRGPKGERWKIKDQLAPLLQAAVELLDKEALFLSVNTYTTDLKPETVRHLLDAVLQSVGFPTTTHSDDIGLPITTMDQTLFAGVTTRWCYDENLL